MCAVVLALVFTYSAFAKFRDIHPTRRALRAARLPVGLARVVAVIEVFVAVALFVLPSTGAVVAIAVLVVFTAFIAYLLARGIETSCGCFGANAKRSVSSIDVVRNAFLLALAVAATSVSEPSVVHLEEVIAVTIAMAIGVVVLTAMGTRRDLGQLFDNRLPGER